MWIPLFTRRCPRRRLLHCKNSPVIAITRLIACLDNFVVFTVQYCPGTFSALEMTEWSEVEETYALGRKGFLVQILTAIFQE